MTPFTVVALYSRHARADDRSVRAAVLLFLAGCNGLLGLDLTADETIDFDRDGVRDSEDNCPRVANPDQADDDGDAVGNACDLCEVGLACEVGARTGIDHDSNCVDDGCEDCTENGPGDEDGDGIVDGCDSCPGIAGGNVDSDGDGLGDACDLNDGAQSRLLFDAFSIDGDPAPASWDRTSGWTVEAGALISSETLPLTAIATITPGIATGDWQVSAGIDMNRLVEGGTFVRIRVLAPLLSAGTPPSCTLERQKVDQAREFAITNGIERVPFDTEDEVVTLRISYLAQPSIIISSVHVRCEAVIPGSSVRIDSVSSLGHLDQLTAELQASQNLAFTYAFTAHTLQ